MNWKYFGKVHGWLYKLSGGKFGANMGRIDVVLLETTGRKSGKKRVAPIAFGHVNLGGFIHAGCSRKSLEAFDTS